MDLLEVLHCSPTAYQVGVAVVVTAGITLAALAAIFWWASKTQRGGRR